MTGALAPGSTVGQTPAGWAEATYAGGVVELAFPPELNASELPHRRRVLLVLSAAAEPPQSPAELASGYWLSLTTARRSPQPDPAATLARLRPNAKLGERSRVSVDGQPAACIAFNEAGEAKLFAAPGEALPSSGERLGWLIETDTPWGRVELGVVGRAGDRATLWADFQRLLATVQFGDPETAPADPRPETLAAEPILGAWKSARGTMELAADGGVRIRFDSDKAFVLGRHGSVDYRKPTRELAGEFAAEGDLVRIRWADGSLLNFRWRVAGSELLITDHHGRTRRLARLYR
ncbi:MAG: hypothetical protein AAGJ46_19760 [Planctomycetota bacterium]